MGVTKCKTVDWHLSTYSLEHNIFFYRNLTGISSLFCLIKTFTHFTTRLINEAHSWIWICRLQRTNGSLLLFLAERYLFMLASLPNILSFFKSVPAQTVTYFCLIRGKNPLLFLLHLEHCGYLRPPLPWSWSKAEHKLSLKQLCLHSLRNTSLRPSPHSCVWLILLIGFCSVFPQSCDLVTSVTSTGPSGMKQITFNKNCTGY